MPYSFTGIARRFLIFLTVLVIVACEKEIEPGPDQEPGIENELSPEVTARVSFMEYSIAVVPDDTSMTWIMSTAEEDYFHVNMQKLLEEQSWVDAFDRGLYYLNVAAAFDQILWHCYLDIYPDCWDHMIFLEEASRSSLL